MRQIRPVESCVWPQQTS